MNVRSTQPIASLALAVLLAACENTSLHPPTGYPEPSQEQAGVAAQECRVKDWSYTADYTSFDALPDGNRFFFYLEPLAEDRVEVEKGGYFWDFTKRAQATEACLSKAFARMKVSVKFGSSPTGSSEGPHPPAPR